MYNYLKLLKEYIVYNLVMKRQKLKELLLEHYESDMAKSVLSGRRKPNITVMHEANTKLKIPVIAWHDIKSYLKSDDKKVA